MILPNMSSVAPAASPTSDAAGTAFYDGVIVTRRCPRWPAIQRGDRVQEALAKYFPARVRTTSRWRFHFGQRAVDALKRCGPADRHRRLVDILENTRNLDLGLGVPLGLAAASTRLRTRSGERSSTKPENTRRSNLNDRFAALSRYGAGAAQDGALRSKGASLSPTRSSRRL